MFRPPAARSASIPDPLSKIEQSRPSPWGFTPAGRRCQRVAATDLGGPAAARAGHQSTPTRAATNKHTVVVAIKLYPRSTENRLGNEHGPPKLALLVKLASASQACLVKLGACEDSGSGLTAGVPN
jgi:hypothetical protein